jgi:hypothetical protein
MADNIPRTSPQAYVPKRLAQGWFALDSKSTLLAGRVLIP